MQIQPSGKESLKADYLLSRIEHSVSTQTTDGGTNKVFLDCQDKRITVDSVILGEEVRFDLGVFCSGV